MKFMQIKPQKARGVFREDLWTDPAWSAENKEDGDRRIAQFTGTNLVCRVRYTGTRESVDGSGFVEKTDNIPHLSATPTELVGTVLDGEIVAPWASRLPGGASKHVTAIMGSAPVRAWALQSEGRKLQYRVFDCLWYKGKDIRQLRLEDRRAFVRDAVAEWDNPYASCLDVLESREGKQIAWEEAREGLVFKHASHTYGNEKLWVKLKKEATADVVLVGVQLGKGKYAGTVGALVFAQTVEGKLVRMGTCSGFDDALRAEIYKNTTKYRGRVFRIKHNGREPTGAFRHPRFDGWRDDKNPKDCVFDPEES